MEAALAGLEPAAAADLASHVWRGLSASLDVAGQAITLLPDEVTASCVARPGWLVLADEFQVIALKTGADVAPSPA
jgi:hypothetical protein